jgi:hypothetical protein
MYDLIKKIFRKSKESDNESKPNVLNINISVNVETLDSEFNLDLSSLKIEENITEQTEKIGNVLSILTYKNSYLTEAVLRYINKEKQTPTNSDNILYYNNILFFWKEYILLRDNVLASASEPIIKPSKAFKLHLLEDK